MLALIGLLGIALSAVALIDTDEATNDIDSLTGSGSDGPPAPLAQISLNDIMFPDESLGGEGRASVAFGGDEADAMSGTTGEDYLDGRDGADTLAGGPGADTLHGGRGDDVVIGGLGDDAIWGHIGNDILFGDAGDDLLEGGDGNDRLVGGDGHDELSGGAGDDWLQGGDGHDTLMGGAGHDRIDGRDQGADFLNGGAGDDTILAGEGDTIGGGPGADRIIISIDDAGSLITDFDPAADRLEIAYTSETPPALRIEEAAGGVRVIADDKVLVTLSGVNAIGQEQLSLVRA